MISVSFIGAGNLATHLALTMASKGYRINCIYSRTIVSAITLAAKLSAQFNITTRAANSLKDIPQSDIIIISVTDSALESIIASMPTRLLNALFLHTAGSMPLSIFNALPQGDLSSENGEAEGGKKTIGVEGGRSFGVLYPMQTFSKNAPVDFSHIPTFVEGSDEATTQQIRKIALSLTDNVTILSSDDRKYLHIAAVFACNFANHVIDLGSTLLANHGIDPRCLLPLIDMTCSKLHTLSPREAQTGPAVRHDENVIDNHMNILSEDEHLGNVYKILSESIMHVNQSE